MTKLTVHNIFAQLAQAITFTDRAGKAVGWGSAARDLGQAYEKLVLQATRAEGWHYPGFVRRHWEALGQWLQPGAVGHLQEEVLHRPHGQSRKVLLQVSPRTPLAGWQEILLLLLRGHQVRLRYVGGKGPFTALLMQYIAAAFPGGADMLRMHTPKEGCHAYFLCPVDNKTDFAGYFQDRMAFVRPFTQAAAVLDGQEGPEMLKALAADMLVDFGLHPNNVKKLYVPEGYSPDTLFPHTLQWSALAQHSRYSNYYDYNRSLYLMDNKSLYENGLLMFHESNAWQAPVGMVYLAYYKQLDGLRIPGTEISFIEGHSPAGTRAYPFGQVIPARADCMPQREASLEFINSL